MAQRQVRKSTGQTDLKKAERAAKKIYIELTSRGQRGLSINGFALEQVANDFLQNYQRKVTRGEKTQKDLQNVTGVVTRYFIPFFGKTAIDEIQEADIDDYKDWRKDYWISGPGKDIDFITYQRGGRTLRRPVDHKVPSLSRQHQELSFLRQIFGFASRKRFIDAKAIPPVRAEPVKNNQGPGLTAAEFQHLVDTEQERLDAAKYQAVRKRCFILGCYVYIAGKTGMRPTELMNLRWGDINGFDLSKDDHPDADAEEVSISVRGKGRFGNSIPTIEGIITLSELFDLWRDKFGKPPSPDDPVFFRSDGTPIRSFRGGFSSLLKAAGLLFDREGRRRNSYCLRHYYITEQIKQGTPLYVIAINTRTSVAMIEKTYSHVTPAMFADKLYGD